MEELNDAEIPKFYSGRDVLITGGTGFMGKIYWKTNSLQISMVNILKNKEPIPDVLVARLLSTCPDVGRLLLLLRCKQDSAPDHRLAALKDSPVFNEIRERCPWQLDKLCAVPGDITQPRLGLLPESFDALHKVSVVIHNAAKVKFNEALQVAVDNNVLPVIQVLEVCDMLPNMQVLVHVSTAYSHSERTCIEEKLYPPPVPLQELLNFIKYTPEPMLQKKTQKYVYPKPNTYTFTKAMAEGVLGLHHNKRYRIAIVRPSIVAASLRYPFPGWIDNLNGPTALIVGGGKGLLHCYEGFGEYHIDILPVDIAIDTIIAVAWDIASESASHLKVYNCSTIENPISVKDLKDKVTKNLREVPLGRPLWYPYGFLSRNRYMYKLFEVILQTAPLHIMHYATYLFGVKSPLDLRAVSQKLKLVNDSLRYFNTREWRFETDNVRGMRFRLSTSDAEIFNLDPNTINWDEYFKNYVKGTRRYLLKLSDGDMKADLQHMKRLCMLHYGVIIFVITITLRAVGLLTRDKFNQTANILNFVRLLLLKQVRKQANCT